MKSLQLMIRKWNKLSSILNPNIKKIDENEKIKFSKKSIIQEKIKQIEIQNNFENPNIPNEYLESFLKKFIQK